MPFANLAKQHEPFADEILHAIGKVVAGGEYILGSEVAAFERDWAAYCGVSGAVGVNSGTDAIALALIASGSIKPGHGDEIITTPLTAGYTALAILQAGAKPVFADICPDTLLLDPASVERAITTKTKAIIPVNLYGQMCDMTAFTAIAERHRLVLVEDCAQAHGAKLNGKMAGSFGNAAAFSFYPTKNLGAIGDGGAVTSDDTEFIERIKYFRQGGHTTAMKVKSLGRNSRLDEIQAAILRIKLRSLDEMNDQRKLLAERYNDRLTGSRVKLPFTVGDRESHVFHLFVIRCEQRTALREHMSQFGIETLIHYPNLLHRQPLFVDSDQIRLPNAETAAKHILSLPLNPALSIAEVDLIADAVLHFYR